MERNYKKRKKKERGKRNELEGRDIGDIALFYNYVETRIKGQTTQQNTKINLTIIHYSVRETWSNA